MTSLSEKAEDMWHPKEMADGAIVMAGVAHGMSQMRRVNHRHGFMFNPGGFHFYPETIYPSQQLVFFVLRHKMTRP